MQCCDDVARVIHDAESVPKLYGNPRMLGFFAHAQSSQYDTRLTYIHVLYTYIYVCARAHKQRGRRQDLGKCVG